MSADDLVPCITRPSEVIFYEKVLVFIESKIQQPAMIQYSKYQKKTNTSCQISNISRT